jgi:hypothetical protein
MNHPLLVCFLSSSLSFLACCAEHDPASADAEPTLAASNRALSAKETLKALTENMPDAFTDVNKFGQPKQGDVIVKQVGIRGEWPEFRVTSADTFAWVNDGYPDMDAQEFEAFVRETAENLARELLRNLEAQYAVAFSDHQILGQPKTGDAIVKHPGIRGEWPEFEVDEDGRFTSVNYPASFRSLRLAEFEGYVSGVAAQLTASTESSREVLERLKADHPQVFSDTNMGRPAQRDAVVKQPGLRGEWPEFEIAADDSFACINYPTTYGPYTASAFEAYVLDVKKQLGL